MDIVMRIWGEDVIASFRQNSPRRVLVGSLEWLRPYLGAGHKAITDNKLSKIITVALNDAWTHIRAFHGCSVSDVSSYYSLGIKPLNLEKTNEWARHYFLSVCPRLNNGSMSHAIERLGSDYDARDDERVFLALDCLHLLENCAHYLIYGSEYLIALAADLRPEDRKGEACDFRRYLKGRGIPTVFVCNIPFNRMDFSALVELGQLLLAETFRGLIDPNHTPLSRRFGFPISGTLEPEHIVAHFHPDLSQNPLEPFIYATPKSKSCISCPHVVYSFKS